jgi:serine/threonine protein kinase
MESFYTIEPSRLVWDPNDKKKISEGGSLLGEGSFGSVYRGSYNHATVAIKITKQTESSPSPGQTAAGQQHAREVRRLLELRFKYVVQCYGISKHPISSDVLIVTECLEGGSLFQSLQEARAADARLSDLSFLTIASHVAKGLSYIHDSGFIHGDMKPHNVLLTGKIEVDADRGIAEFPQYVDAKLADFGMSKRLHGPPNTPNGQLMMSSVGFGDQPFGTYAYMAPEIFQGGAKLEEEDYKRVDVYAFGVVLYEMLTGVSPWQLECVQNSHQLYQLVCVDQRRPAWGPRSDNIRYEYKRMIESCWHQKNDRRPRTGELIAQLDAWIKALNDGSGSPERLSSDANCENQPGAMKGDPGVVRDDESVPKEKTDMSEVSRRVESLTVSDGVPSQVQAELSSVKNDESKPPATPDQKYWERRPDGVPAALRVLNDSKCDPGESVDQPVAVHGQRPSKHALGSGALNNGLQQFSEISEVSEGHTSTSPRELGEEPANSSDCQAPGICLDVPSKSAENVSADAHVSAVAASNSNSSDLANCGQLNESSTSTSAPNVSITAEPGLPTLPQTFSVQSLVQAVHAPNETLQILRWWKEGHIQQIAVALAKGDIESCTLRRFELISELLEEIADAPDGATKQAVAKHLCVALGNAARGAMRSSSNAKRGIPIVLKALHGFTYVLSVYGAAFYALANLLKLSNEFPDVKVRRQIAEWLSHGMSYNLTSDMPGARSPTLAYTTACAVRNFVWINDANASVFLEPGSGTHGSPVEQLRDSMLAFRLHPIVAEACLGAFGALAYYPRHRISLVRVKFVHAACQVMSPPEPTAVPKFNVLAMGLTALGILVSGPLALEERSLIGAALRDEGGVRSSIVALRDGVGARSFEQMEASVSAIVSIARFDRTLGEKIIELGGVQHVSRAVWCAVATPDNATVRYAEIMCVAAAVLLHQASAEGIMRQNNLGELLAKLVARYPSVPRVTVPGEKVIRQLRLA